MGLRERFSMLLVADVTHCSISWQKRRKFSGVISSLSMKHRVPEMYETHKLRSKPHRMRSDTTCLSILQKDFRKRLSGIERTTTANVLLSNLNTYRVTTGAV